MKPAISVEHLSKQYHLGSGQQGAYYTLREKIGDAVVAFGSRLSGRFSRSTASGTNGQTGSGARASTTGTLWALNDVTFDVQPGEVLGVIGRNGAGKSTLLKVFSRITEPTAGRVTLRGRVGSLLEVGTGFHPELTGRENIYLNGAILGMNRQQIARRFDDIVSFAEVEQFLDTPVKRYSSGMFVRLAFAVACHLDPEILVVDEVLAVGDAAFQRKCLGKMNDVSRSGRTVLFVSHNMATILNLCDQVAVLDRGRLLFLGDPEKGIQLYTKNNEVTAGSEIDLSSHPNRRPGCPPILGKVRLLNSAGKPTDQLLCGEAITIEIQVDPRCTFAEPHFAIGFDDTLGCRLFTLATYLSDSLPDIPRQPRRLLCRLDQLPLCPGRYCLTLNAGPRQNVWTDMIDQALWLEVTPTDFYGNGRLPNSDWGRFLMHSRWQAECPRS
jgi:lipopolysaccharide transport system ATP-binding protein